MKIKENMTKKEINKTFYVDNALFSEKCEEYSALCRPLKIEWLKNIPEGYKSKDWAMFRPKISNYMGKSFLMISSHLTYRPNFSSYTWKTDMISDGVENCIHYCDNFNIEKGKAFAYFTQICWYAFLRRIDKENVMNELIKRVPREKERDCRAYVSFQDHDAYDCRFIKDAWDFTSPTENKDSWDFTGRTEAKND
jgi:hypothetical protein